MKYSLRILTCTMILNAGLIGMASAQDYGSMSTEDMVQLRSQVRYMSPNDRTAYRAELKSREQNMSKEEKSRYRNMHTQGGDGKGADKRYGQGSGDGSGNKNRHGQGNTTGSGSMNRYGQGASGGYGSGYGSRQGGGSAGGRGR